MLSVSIEIQASLALFERIFDYLKMPHDIVDRPDARVVAPADVRGDVKLDQVYFRYDRGTLRADGSTRSPNQPSRPPTATSTSTIPSPTRRAATGRSRT